MSDEKQERSAVIECPSWNAFIQKIREHGGNPKNPNIIYRGQSSCDWALAAPLGREHLKHFDKIKQGEIKLPEGVKVVLPDASVLKSNYEKYFDAFRELVATNGTIDTKNFEDLDWWTLGRHNGLITPLIDWSQSPYIAAFFAFDNFFDYANKQNGGLGAPMKGRATKDGKIALWQLTIDEKDVTKDEYEFITHLNFENERQKRQKGVFTYLIDNEYCDLESYLTNRSLSNRLVKYEVSFTGDELMQALNDLGRMGITRSHLFPDLYGCAQEANMRCGCGY